MPTLSQLEQLQAVVDAIYNMQCMHSKVHQSAGTLAPVGHMQMVH